MKGRSRKLALVIVLLVVVACCFLKQHVWNAYCSFLVVQDDLKKADVIIVLGGASGERTLQAVDLYKKGYAPRILMCGGKGVWRITWGEVMGDLAVERGVPRYAVIAEGSSRTTIEEALNSKRVMEERGFKSAIVVSSPYHMRRVSLLFRKVFKGSGASLSFYPAQEENMEEPGRQDHPELYYLEACKLLYSWKLFLPWTSVQ